MSQRPTPPYTSDASARPVNLKDGDLENAVPLPDFMQELGVLLRLPKRQVTRPVVVIPETTVPPRRWNLRSAALATMAVALLAAVGVARFSPAPRPDPLPEELRGEWRTTNPKYRQRILSFTEDRVGLSMAEGETPSLHPIVAMSSRAVSDTVVISMTYRDDDGPVDFRVSLVKGARPLLWLSNPPDVVWEPVGRAVQATNPPSPDVQALGGGPVPITPYAPGQVRPWEH